MSFSNSFSGLCASVLAGALFAFPLAAPAAAEARVPSGVWLWDNGDAAVEFHACGASLCARIVWVKEETAPGAGVMLDARNPDAALQRRRVCGLDYITGLTSTDGQAWKKGRIYDYHSGKTYDLDIDTVTDTEVRMRGYSGMRLLGATLKLIRPGGAALACKAVN